MTLTAIAQRKSFRVSVVVFPELAPEAPAALRRPLSRGVPGQERLVVWCPALQLPARLAAEMVAAPPQTTLSMQEAALWHRDPDVDTFLDRLSDDLQVLEGASMAENENFAGPAGKWRT